MTLSVRDKRALVGLGITGVLLAMSLLSSSPGQAPNVVSASYTIPAAERRLAQVRRLAAAVPGKQELLKHAGDELAGREKPILQAQTAAQAQAQLLDVVRRAGKAQTPPLEFGSVDLSQEVKRLGEYGVVEVTVPFNCRMEDLVNFLAELTRQPEAVAASDMRVTAGDKKQKTISVRVTISGLVPHRLVPVKKGLGAL